MSLSKLNTELATLQAKLEDREAGVNILQERLKSIQHAYDHFDNCAHDTDQGYYHSEFSCYLEELNPELSEQLRNHFSSDYATCLKQFSNDYDSQYNEFVSNISHDNFEEYKRLAEVIEAIEDRISEREDQESELEDQVWDKEQEIEDLKETLLKVTCIDNSNWLEYLTVNKVYYVKVSEADRYQLEADDLGNAFHYSKSYFKLS